MATRSSWKGYLQLSLVCVPVKAYSTSSSGGGEIHLHQLHADCHSRIQYKKVCPLHGREQLVLLRPRENLLVLEVLHYRHQVTQPSALADEVPRMEVSPEELQMARTLVSA